MLAWMRQKRSRYKPTHRKSGRFAVLGKFDDGPRVCSASLPVHCLANQSPSDCSLRKTWMPIELDQARLASDSAIGGNFVKPLKARYGRPSLAGVQFFHHWKGSGQGLGVCCAATLQSYFNLCWPQPNRPCCTCQSMRNYALVRDPCGKTQVGRS